MLISKTKKGFTLVEVLVSISLFAVLFSSALSVMLNSKKMEGDYERLNKNLAYLEGVKGVMAYNFSYGDLLNLKNENRLYLSNENLNYEYLKDERIISAFTCDEPLSKPYISINIQGDSVLKATIFLHEEKEIFQAEFYKGSYKRKAA